MADLTKATIEQIPLGINGVPVAITATGSPGTDIYTVPSDPDAWYEVTLIVSNNSGSFAYAFVTQWGGTATVNTMSVQLGALSSLTMEPRICRGITIKGYCLTTGGGPGVNNALNVQVKVLRYGEPRS